MAHAWLRASGLRFVERTGSKASHSRAHGELSAVVVVIVVELSFLAALPSPGPLWTSQGPPRAWSGLRAAQGLRTCSGTLAGSVPQLPLHTLPWPSTTAGGALRYQMGKGKVIWLQRQTGLAKML